MDKQEFGIYLKSLRKEKKLTIVELSKLSAVSHPYISQIENGQFKPSPDVLEKLADPLGVDHSELMIRAGYVKKSDILKELEKFKEGEYFKYEFNVTKSLKFILETLSDGENFHDYLEDNLKIVHKFCKERFGDNFILTPASLIDLSLKVDWNTIQESETTQSEFDISVFELFSILESLAEFTIKEMDDIANMINYEGITYKGHKLTENDRKLITNFLDALFSNRD
jgi:transcriptional regulator with XRE-family HTH domain